MQKSFVMCWLICIGLLSPFAAQADYLLIPMDNGQREHLKAYGLAYWVLEYEVDVEWLLNYRGGSFMFKHSSVFEQEMQIRNIGYERISDGKANEILAYVASDDVNMDALSWKKRPVLPFIPLKTNNPGMMP